MPIRIIDEWLGTCAGCEMSLLDVGEALLDLLPAIEIVHSPVLMDHKYYPKGSNGTKPEIPEADVALITSCVRNEENKLIAQEVRNKSKLLIATGSCACFGGIPALANLSTREELFEKVYRGIRSTEPGDPPTEHVPPLLDRVYALDEVVKVDLYLPGCPTDPSLLVEALKAAIENKPFTLPEKAVCEDCPLKREKKAISVIRRPLQQPEEADKCLLEQGFLCLGPVTRTGCGGTTRTPRCIAGGFPCRGCFGPLSFDRNQMVDLLSAIATIGVDVKQIPDRYATFARFTGSKGVAGERKAGG
jgi:F420-non-reducing hydrogenase small subunit